MDYNQEFNSAIDQIEAGDYMGGFSRLVELYGREETRDAVLPLLMDVFYLPNEAALQERYEANRALLEEYPYVLGATPPEFSELSSIIFPVNSVDAYVYDKQADAFTYIEINSARETKYFFQDISKEFFIEDETNLFNLRYLVENIRASEDMAMDNHIYLHYRDPQLFYCLMQVVDFAYLLLETKKLVFLVGPEAKGEYPIDFKAKYGIDYAAMEFQPVRVEELKRCVYGRVVFNQTGTTFFNDVLDWHPNLLTYPFTQFDDFHNFGPYIKDKTVDDLLADLPKLKDDHIFKKSIDRLVNGRFAKFSPFQRRLRVKQYLNKLGDVLGRDQTHDARTWWSGFSLAHAYFFEREFPDRIVPAVCFFPHNMAFGEYERWWVYYTKLCMSYPYFKMIMPLRDAVCCFGGSVKLKLNRDPIHEILNVLSAECKYGSVLYQMPQSPLYQNARVIRFEDLKLNPRATLEPMTEFLGLPWSDALLAATVYGKDVGVSFSTSIQSKDSWDTRPVYHYLEDETYLSKEDKYRLEMLLFTYTMPFGYIPKFYDGKEYAWEEVEEMMMKPFKVESPALEDGTFDRKTFELYRKRTVLPNSRYCFETPIPTEKSGIPRIPIKMIEPREDLLKVPLYR